MKTHRYPHHRQPTSGASLAACFGQRGVPLSACLFGFLFSCLVAFSQPVLAQDGRDTRDDSRSTLRIGMAADITSVDPHLSNISPNNQIGWHVFEALTHVDDNARLVPGLASSWRAVDPRTWEFKLRPNVKFHDGTTLAARDVLASIERARKLANGQFAGFTRTIIAAEAPDALTVRLRTAAPYATLPHDLNSIFIIPARLVNASSEDFNAGRAMIGSGPWRFERYARGDRVELSRFDSHRDALRNSNWSRLVFRILSNDPSRSAALLAGDVDIIEQVPPADLEKLNKNNNLTLARKTSWRTVFLQLDHSRERSPHITDRKGGAIANPLRDVRVRTAISKAINRTAIAARVMEGAAVPAAALVSPQIFGHPPAKDLSPESFDAEAARKLLVEAGYPEGFNLTLHAPNNRYVNDDQLAQAVAQMLTRIGIITKVEVMPANVYFTRARNGEFSVAMLGWGSFSADLALRSLLMTPSAEKGLGTWNWGGYANPRLDQLVERSLSTTEEGKREELAREAMLLAMRDRAAIVLHHQISTWAMKSGLKLQPRTDEYTLAGSLSLQRP